VLVMVARVAKAADSTAPEGGFCGGYHRGRHAYRPTRTCCHPTTGGRLQLSTMSPEALEQPPVLIRGARSGKQ